MVYVSTPALGLASRQAVMQTQAELAKDQTELSSGKIADIGLGLGSASGSYLSLKAEQAQLKAITDANALAGTRLTATASGLSALQKTASSFLASLTAAASAGMNTATLQATAAGNLQDLIATLNTVVDGQAIFGGINSGAAPMAAYTASPASGSKAAVDAAFASAFGTAQTSAGAGAVTGAGMQGFLDGPFASLFGDPAYGSTWSQASPQVLTSRITPTETVNTSVSASAAAFRQLAQAYTTVSEFGTAAFGADAGKAVIASATRLVNDALAGLTAAQAGVGVAQGAISTANDGMAAQITLLSTQADGMDSADTYALNIRLSALETQIQASYSVTAQIQKLSLLNYL